MTLQTLISQIPLVYQNPLPSIEITALISHSKQGTKNCLFVALEPDSSKRYKHILEACHLGTTVVLCPLEDQCTIFPVASSTYFLFSRSPRKDYALLSGNFFQNPTDKLKIIGVTGTNGKTTVTHLIKFLLESMSITGKIGLIGTNENKIGDSSLPATRTTPDAFELHSLLHTMVEEACTHVVMEVSSHGLMQSRTVGIPFALGIFTNLSQDHLDYHETMEEYLNAKSLLFLQCDKAIYNMDSPSGATLARRIPCQYSTYSKADSTCTFHGSNIQLKRDSISFLCHNHSQTYPVSLPIPGMFSVENALAALSACASLGYPLKALCQHLSHTPPVKGRLEVVPAPCDFTIMIDYAHSPDALERVLETLRQTTASQLICLFGCGGNRDKGKRPLMGAIAEKWADIVIITSDNPRYEDPMSIIHDIYPSTIAHSTISTTIQELKENPVKKINKIVSREEGIHFALSLAQKGDTLLLAGKGHETYQEIKGEFFPMDEREIIENFFEFRPKKS